MKKIIYNVIKYPLILIFLKTPIINILNKRFKFHIYTLKKRNIIMHTLDTVFQREYFNKLKSKDEIRELTDSTSVSGEEYARSYYEKHFQTVEELKKRKLGLMSQYEASIIFKKIINYIKKNNLEKNKNVYLIQMGSASGRDLEFFYKIYPELNYISTDVNDEILNFQKKKYNYQNFKFFKCYAEEIEECIRHFGLENKIIILFSIGCLQHVNPYFMKEFFLKIRNINNLNLFINDPVSLSFIDSKEDLSKFRGNSSFSHKYADYAKDGKVLEEKIVRPYDKNDPIHKDTGIYYLHLKS